jgi:hypothetical protein
VLLATAAFAIPGTANAASSPDSIGVRLVDIPADAVDDPRARIYIVDHLAPGTVIQRRIEVVNSSDSTTEIALYASAAEIVAGAFLGASGHTANDLSSWTSLAASPLSVPPNSSLLTTVTITAPRDAAPGEHYAVVWAEARSAPSPETGVTTVTRVGIRIYLSVGPGGAPAADFSVDSLTASRGTAGAPVVVARVHNTGGRALDIHGSLLLANGPAGLSAGPFAVTVGTTIAVGETEAVTVVLDAQVPAGPWDATITLSSGLLERSATATIAFPESGSSPPVATSSPAGWLVMLGVAIALTAGAIVLYRIRRRAKAKRP